MEKVNVPIMFEASYEIWLRRESYAAHVRSAAVAGIPSVNEKMTMSSTWYRGVDINLDRRSWLRPAGSSIAVTSRQFAVRPTQPAWRFPRPTQTVQEYIEGSAPPCRDFCASDPQI